jgi:hypothetical protein
MMTPAEPAVSSPSSDGVRVNANDVSPRRLDAASGVYRKGSDMTPVCCPSCRLRFARSATTHLTSCPECGGSLHQASGAAELLGFRLHVRIFTAEDMAALAVEAALPVPPEESF